jgi:MFS family permease
MQVVADGPDPGFASIAKVLLAVTLCCFLVSITTVLPLSLLPMIGADFPGHAGLLNWTVIVATLAGAVAAGLFPTLATIFGQRRMLMVAMGALAIGAAISALSPNIYILIAGRFVSAFCLGALTVSLVVLRTTLPRRLFAIAIGAVICVEGLGTAVGFVSGGLVTEVVDLPWRAVFWILAALAALVVGVVFVGVPQATARTIQRVDWAGGALLGVALVFILLPVSQGGAWGWTSWRVLGLLALGLVAAVVWWIHESRIPDPMFNTHAIRDRNFAIGWVIFFMSAGLGFGINYTVPSFMGITTDSGFGFGYNALGVGMTLVPYALSMCVTSLVAGTLAKWVTVRVLSVIASGSIAISFVLLANFNTEPWQVILWPVIAGIGYGIAGTVAFIVLIRTLPKDQADTASSIGQIAGLIGGSVLGAVITAILTSDVSGLRIPTLHGFEVVWWLLAGLAVLCGACGLALNLPAGHGEDIETERIEAGAIVCQHNPVP